MSLSSKLLQDLKSGFSVFLIALPLCLGIAMASSAPPIAGVFTAIVGGCIATFLGSSRLTIKGPAAGLIVIVLGAITELGYQKALAVGVVASVIQILFAVFKLAVYAEIMPLAVIHGMLAAIGVIIISKQMYVLLGVVPTVKNPVDLLINLPQSIPDLNPGIFLIGLVCFLTAIFWPKLKKFKVIPASVLILAFAIGSSLFFNISTPHLYSFFGKEYNFGPNYLIKLPDSVLSAIVFPDFSSILSSTSIKYIISYSLVGTIESLLTVCAVDIIDPEKQKSDLNKDLFALGCGNLIASFIGGLPMISEIVRTRANIDYGAKDRYSNFFHGTFLLLSILFVSPVLMLIPLSALAAMLIFVGLRLASYREFELIYKIGIDQFVIFMTTLLLTIKVDLLVGVIGGLLLKIVFHLFRGAKIHKLFSLNSELVENNNKVEVNLFDAVIFTNFTKLKSIITKHLSDKKKVTLNFSKAYMVDHTVLEKLESIEKESNGSVSLGGLNELKPAGNYLTSFRKKK